MRTPSILRSALATVALLCAAPAFAQAWPDKPVRIVVNFGTGGAPDVVARLYAPKLAEALGQPVVVENRAGAGGNIGVEAVVRATDGHTLLASASSSFVIGPHLYKLAFDPVKDIAPVAPLAMTPMYLVAGPQHASLAELLAALRAHPGKLNYGSAGNGTLPHIAAEMLLRTAGLQAVHVPFKGSGAALAALLGGQVQFVFDPGVAIPQAKAGKVRLLAVGTAARLSALPETPTLREGGADMTAVSIVGLFAPVATPAGTVERLNREALRIMQLPEVRQALAGMAAEPMQASAQEFSGLLARERDRYGALVRAADIRVE